jgi:hypothetical protein
VKTVREIERKRTHDNQHQNQQQRTSLLDRKTNGAKYCTQAPHSSSTQTDEMINQRPRLAGGFI